MATRQAIASEVWAQLLRLTRGQRDRFLGISAELNLSPGDTRTLLSLDAADGRPMGQLARAWHCDASYVTAMIDRLEQRGLVERRSFEPDRRVKAAVLTRRGAELREQVLQRIHELPPELLQFDKATLTTLRDTLSRLQTDG